MARRLLVCFLLLACLLVPSAAGWADEFEEAGAETRPLLVDVALDPGHSRLEVGAVGGGLAEYAVTLDVAFRVRAYLEAEGATVRLTREDHEPLSALAHPDLTERTRIEQAARIEAVGPARVYVSLHFNGGPAYLHGTETYYNPERDPTNPHGDWLLADALQRHTRAALAEVGYLSLDRGAKSDLWAGKPYGHFFSLRGPMPSALLEMLFLTNPTEAFLLHEEAARNALAYGCAQGILEYLALGVERVGSED